MRSLPDGVMPMDLIPCQLIFNSSSMFLAPSFHVQRMFRSALLDYTVTVEHDSAIIAKAVASVSHADENGIQNVTVKLINFGGAKADVQVALDGFAPIENGTLRLEILSGAINDTNTLDHPHMVQPRLEAPTAVSGDGKSFTVVMEVWSLAVASWRARVKTDDESNSVLRSCATIRPTQCNPSCAQTIVTALELCSASGGGLVSLSAGTFDMVLSGPPGPSLALSNLSHVTLSGPSDSRVATLMIHGLHGGFHLNNCTGLAIKHIAIDMARNSFTFGQAETVEATSFTLRFDPQRYRFPTGKEWIWLRTVQGVTEFDNSSWRWASQGLDLFEWGPIYPTANVTSPGLLQVSGIGSIETIRAGRWYVVRHQCYGFPAFRIDSCSQTILSDMSLYASPGMGVLATMSTDIELSRVRIERREGRPLSISADASHFASCQGDIVLRDCHFDGQGDDGLNIHGNFGQIENISTDRRTIALSGGPAAEGFDLIAGEMYTIQNRSTCFGQ